MNQITAPDSEQNDMISPSVTAGHRLHVVREGMGLTCADVARELRLQEKLIEALEAGDRSKLPPDTFISGYLRSYARLLGLPAEELIAEYLAERVAESVYRATDRIGMKMTTSREPKYKFVTYAVFGVTALLFAAWFANERFSLVSLEPVQDEAGIEEHQALEANLPAPMPLYQDPPVEEVLTEQGQNRDGSLPADSLNGGAAPKTQASPAVAAPATTAAPPVAPSAEVAKPVQPLPTVANNPLAASVPQSTLALEYQAACWTQVEDANGRVLVYETINAGRKLQLQGVAPFKVYLGYAPGVLIYYNGTLFPHGDYHRGELARFRVGNSQDNRPLVR
jgi:cytoskeleton protein RodZ